MLTRPVLSADQIRYFKADGFLVVRGAFAPDEVARLDRWAQELVAMPEESGRHWVYWEDSLTEPGRKIISRIEKISPFHDGFRELQESLKPAVGQLFGEDAVLFKEKINFKMPGGDGFKPHQDSQAGWDKYAPDFISALVCIDPATIENGCLEIVAGFHEKGLYRSWEPLTEADMAGMVFEPCPTAPGDIIFFDAYAPHASKPNRTNSTRRIYFATYNPASCGDHLEAYYADKHKSYPPDIDRQAGKAYVFRV